VTDHEILVLAVGVALGMDLMLLVQACFWIRDDRRDRKAERAARSHLDAARARAEA
jgi:hypothetical protein